MNKISIFIFLILLYLGLSKSFSPSEKASTYIINQQVFSSYFEGAPLSLVLVDSFQAGFLIKTYFQKYKVIHGFKTPETVIIRTSQKFWKENKKNVGLSLFRRAEGKKIESTTPMPPGILYINDPSYGKWVNSDSGRKVWKFHRAYRHFPNLFMWGKFRPSEDFYKKALIHIENNLAFYGLNNEFGIEGEITKVELAEFINKKEYIKLDFLGHLKKLFEIPKLGKSNG